MFLSEYIRTHVDSLSRMSFDRFLFFVIEKLTSELVGGFRKDLGDLFGIYSEQVWNRLGGSSVRPYSKNEAYEIGRRFGVKPNQFPCIVLFTDLTSKDVLVVEINDFIDIQSSKTNTNTQDSFAYYLAKSSQRSPKKCLFPHWVRAF